MQTFKEAVKHFGKLEDKKYIIVFDLELTCWPEDHPLKSQQMSICEVTEIGAVILDARTLKEKRRFTRTVRPVNHPILTDFCTKLTGITQAEVDGSPMLLDVLSSLYDDGELPDPSTFIWASWGGDARWLQSEVNSKTPDGDEPFSFDPRFINIKLLDATKCGKRRGLKTACKSLGIDQALPAHRALPDAVTTAEVGRKLKMETLDSQVSNDRTYKQTLTRNRQLIVEKFIKRNPSMTPKFVDRLMEKSNWDFQTAVGWVKFFKNNKELL